MAGTFTVPVGDFTRVLSNAAVFAGKDTTLPVLNAVRVEISAPDQNAEATMTAVATDRYTIGMDTCNVSGVINELALLISLPDVQRLVKAAKSCKHGYVVGAVEQDERVRFDIAFDATMIVQQQDGEFPKYRSLIPDDSTLDASDGVNTIAFDPSKLARFDKVQGSGRLDPIKLRLLTPTKPALVTKGDTFIGLIMPIRLAG